MFNYSEVKINDFSGGMTDRYVDGRPNTAEKVSNLNITKFGTLKLREGYRWYLEAGDNYAGTDGKAYMGVLNLPDSENIIINQIETMYVMSEEIENKLSSLADVIVDPSKLVTNVIAPASRVVTSSISSSDLQALLSQGKVPVDIATDASDGSLFQINDSVYITETDETTYITDRTDTVFYIIAVDNSSTPKTLTLSGTLGGSAIDLSENGINVKSLNVLRNTVIGNGSDGRLYVLDIENFTVGDTVHITNSTNSIIRSDGTDQSFFVKSKATNENVGSYIELSATADMAAAFDLTTITLSAGDNVYSSGGVESRITGNGFISDPNDLITTASEHGISTGDEVYFKHVDEKGIGLSENRIYYFNAASTLTGTIHDSYADAVKENAIDTATGPGDSNGDIPVDDATSFAEGDAINIVKADASIVRSDGIEETSDNVFYVLSKPDETTIRVSNILGGDALDVSSIVETGDKIYKNGEVSLTTGLTVGVNKVALTPTTYYSDIVLVKKAKATAVTTPNGGSLLKSSALKNNQHVSFSEWQDQLLTTSEATSLTDLSRPGRIYYGSEPIIVKQGGGASETITATAHGLANGDKVDFITIFGSTPSGLTDNTTYYVRDVATNTFKVAATSSGAAISITFNNEINQFTPVTKSWKSHSLGLPKPCIHTDGSIVDTNMSVTTGSGTGKIYKYAAVYKYIYNSNGVEYTTYGPVRDLNGDGVAYKYEADGALAYDGKVATVGAAGGHTDGTIEIAAGEEANFEIDDEIKITTASAAAWRNSGTSLFVIEKASGEITVSASQGGVALDLDDPALGIVNTDEIYKANGITSERVVRTNPVITVPCLKEPGASSLYSGAQWNLDRISIELYRTKENGSTYYYVDEKPNDKSSSTITITDDKSDNAIGAEKTLYTTGGGADFHPAPPCKYVLNSRDTAYFCNTTEEVESVSGSKMFTYQHPARVYQSIPGISGSIGDVFYTDLDDDIVGIGEISGLPIVFTDTYIYRLEGRISMLGSGDIRARVIDENVGCSSHRSIVKTPKGLFWAGKHGFYQTDGYKVVNITENLDDSFRSVTSTNSVRKLINGTYDEKEGRIFWGVCSGDKLTEPDTIWVYWTRFGAFTTIEGGDIDASDLTVKDSDLFRSDKHGSVLRHSPDYGHDTIKVLDSANRPVSVFSWNDVPILFKYKSNAMSFGLASKRKWVNETSLSFETAGNMCVLPTSSNDGSAIESELKHVKRVSSLTWDDPDFIWGTSDLVWNAPDVITAVRRFPRKEQRCRRKQLNLEPSKFVKYISDNWYTAYMDRKPGETTKVRAHVDKWPKDLSEAEICFPCTYDSTTGKYTYSATGTETKCLKILERESDTTINFFPLSFTGWEGTSAAQYIKTGANSANGYMAMTDLWGWDGTQAKAADRETRLLGLTKDWTISFWMRVDVDKILSTDEGDDLTFKANNGGSLSMNFNHSPKYLKFLMYNWKDETTGRGIASSGGYNLDHFDTTSGYNKALVGDGITWNNITLTHKGTARQTDRRKFGATLFSPEVLATVGSSGHNLASGVVAVDDASGFTVGDMINIVSEDGLSSRFHTPKASMKEGRKVRGHEFIIMAKDDSSTPNTITLSNTNRREQAWVDYSPFPTSGGTTDGSDGRVRITTFENLNVGDQISLASWNSTTGEPTGKLTFAPDGSVVDFYVIAKEYDTAMAGTFITLSINDPETTPGATGFDLSYGAEGNGGTLTTDTRPKIYLTEDIETDGIGTKALVGANLTSSGIVSTDKIYTSNSAHEPSDKHENGGIYTANSTPGLTVYINGSPITNMVNALDSQVAQDIVGFQEWIRTGDTGTENHDILQMFGTVASHSGYQTEGIAFSNVTVWNTHKTASEASDMYNTGVQGDFVDSACKVQVNFNELSDQTLEDGQAIKNSGSDANKLATFRQGPNTVDGDMNWSVAGTTDDRLKWTIKKHQLDQDIEIKEIDIKFGTMDNVEGRYEKEVEKDNA